MPYIRLGRYAVDTPQRSIAESFTLAEVYQQIKWPRQLQPTSPCGYITRNYAKVAGIWVQGSDVSTTSSFFTQATYGSGSTTGTAVRGVMSFSVGAGLIGPVYFKLSFINGGALSFGIDYYLITPKLVPPMSFTPSGTLIATGTYLSGVGYDLKIPLGILSTGTYSIMFVLQNDTTLYQTTPNVPVTGISPTWGGAPTDKNSIWVGH